jgi:hypothetical protein
MNKLEFFGVWNGSNYTEIISAMYASGYRTTKVSCYKGKIFIENNMISEVIIIGDEIKLPIVNELDDEEEENGISRQDDRISESS